MQKSEVTVQMEPGKTLVIGGFMDKQPNEEERELVILVTPRIIDPEPEKEVQLEVSVTRVKTEETQLAWPEEPKNLPFVPAEQFKKSKIKIAVFTSQDCALQTQLSDLRNKGRAKLLLERWLTTLSGHSADTVTGGQMPVIAKSSNGATQIHYVPVGANLKLLPTIVDPDRIRLSFRAELSDVDHSMPTTISTSAGTARMPGLTTRNITNVVELRSGEILAVRGIIQDGEEVFILVTPRILSDDPGRGR